MPAMTGTRVAVGVTAVAAVAHVVVLAIWPAAHTLLIDLQVYRAGGEFLRAGRPLYDGGVLLDLPFVYPPFAAVLFGPLAGLPWPVLAAGWTVLGVGLLAVVVHRCGATGLPLVALVAVATWLDPVRTTLYLGQINIVLLAVVLLDLLRRRPGRWQGVGVGLAAAVKLTPLLFVAYLLLTRRFRAAATAAVAFTAAAGLGFLLAPADSARFWGGTFAAAGRISDPAGPSNHSLAGFVGRTWGSGTLLPSVVLAVVTLAVAAVLRRRGDEPLAVTLVGLGSAAAAPFAWSHHWVWIVPLLVLARQRRALAVLAGTVAVGLAVITRLPGPAVGPVPATGVISLLPDAYLVAFLVLLDRAGRGEGPTGVRWGPRRGASVSR